eukprot:scaffold22829_cov75-Phaeocystis_antarctica.AAC.2
MAVRGRRGGYAPHPVDDAPVSREGGVAPGQVGGRPRRDLAQLRFGQRGHAQEAEDGREGLEGRRPVVLRTDDSHSLLAEGATGRHGNTPARTFGRDPRSFLRTPAARARRSSLAAPPAGGLAHDGEHANLACAVDGPHKPRHGELPGRPCADAAFPLALCRHCPAIADLLLRPPEACLPARGHIGGVRAVQERVGRAPGEAQPTTHDLAKDRAPVSRQRGRERNRIGARPAATRAAAIVAAAPHHLLPRVDLAVESRGGGRPVRDGRVVRDALVEVEGSGVELTEYVEVRDAQPPPAGLGSTRLEARVHSVRIKARPRPYWEHFERLRQHHGSGAAQLQA